MRQLAGRAYGTRSVWLQAVLMNAVQAGAMTHDAYVDAIVHLAAYRHGPVAVNARDILSAYVGDTSDELVRLQALCTYIGHENSDPESHIALAAGFINSIYSNASPHDLKVRAATNLIFKALLSDNRGDDWARWAVTFSRGLPRTRELAFWIGAGSIPSLLMKSTTFCGRLGTVEGHTSSSHRRWVLLVAGAGFEPATFRL